MRPALPGMNKLVLAVLAGAALLGVGVALQQSRSTDTQEAAFLSLPVFASDGKRIGEVVQVGVYQGQKAIVARVDPEIGVRPQGILIPRNLFREKADRIEVTMTSAEFKSTLAKEQQP